MTQPAVTEDRRSAPFRDVRNAVIIGVAALAIVISTAGVWAVTAPIASAVIAPAQVVVDSNVRRIQHPTGGVVAGISVNDGDYVHAGDELLRLDETLPRANLALIENQLNQFWTRRARLQAEQNGRDAMPVPVELTGRTDEPAIAQIIEGETALLLRRREAITGQQSQLGERKSQIGEEIRGLAAQIDSKREQIRLIQRELEGVRQLFDKNLIPYARLTALEREAARLTGEEGQLIADTARAKGRITETELQIIQLTQDQRREVATDLREVEIKIADLAERRIAAQDQLTRVVLRAPQDGLIHQKAVHTVGGVISPGEQLMLIVPKDSLVIEARVEPQMIDRLKPGQPAKLRFTAFDTAVTPELDGTLTRIAADLTKDQQSGAAYYVVRINLAERELARLEGKVLVPGMPVEAYIQNGVRTALAYLRKPLEDQLARAFRQR
ncbi:Type I secretion membrane fusion protein, HlyD [Rhodopseudomonas palustris HaA2]|uniref:Membrane fusion protein (MFP) family protein n=1 Tax=Rhodopseudomonas palustris (strain HaA2) TaxID=316058 RepID=Q2J1Z8_RHOP2|nr:HlyD family type I secretion periplasmic adaptor subunit [Rhodopseudomonas palustris]ABD05512.1 Type I secretion membrane fusion protein, HlyD [Rhodopseudomonas palustris HaA2]